MGKHILSIDVGTQTIKGVVYDFSGRVIVKEKKFYDAPYFFPKPGYCEREAEDYWSDLVFICKRIFQNGINAVDIEAISITTQRATTIFLGKNFKPIRPAVLWLDKREAEKVPNIGFYEVVFRIVGAYKTVKAFQKKSVVNWVIENEPELWEKTRYVCHLSTYLNYKLTNAFCDSYASQVGYLPFNFKKKQWELENSWKYKAVPVALNMLPKLVDPSDIIGYVTEEASKETGLLKGIPVIATASDKACELLGVGAYGKYDAALSFGTTATINFNSDNYLEVFRFFPSYPSAIKDAFNVEYQVFRGFWLITWFKEQFAKLESKTADSLGITTEDLLEQRVSNISAGSDGLILHPFWSQGAVNVKHKLKGSIIGFTDKHKMEHVYKALIEGLMFALREGKEAIENKMNVRLKRLFASGGGAKSGLVVGCAADIMNLPVFKPSNVETSSLGAAMLAALGVGKFNDIYEAINAMKPDGEFIYPKPENVRVYDDIFKNVFVKVKGKLSPFYEIVDKISLT